MSILHQTNLIQYPVSDRGRKEVLKEGNKKVMTLYQINLASFLWLSNSSYSLYSCVLALNRFFSFYQSLLKIGNEYKFLCFIVYDKNMT